MMVYNSNSIEAWHTGTLYVDNYVSPMQTTVQDSDRKFMRQALDLARRGLGHTSPNPAVGCVIVKEGQVVGEGFHPKAGMPHAEVYALRGAGVVHAQEQAKDHS